MMGGVRSGRVTKCQRPRIGLGEPLGDVAGVAVEVAAGGVASASTEGLARATATVDGAGVAGDPVVDPVVGSGFVELPLVLPPATYPIAAPPAAPTATSPAAVRN
jgi:hypothetical protein